MILLRYNCFTDMENMNINPTHMHTVDVIHVLSIYTCTNVHVHIHAYTYSYMYYIFLLIQLRYIYNIYIYIHGVWKGASMFQNILMLVSICYKLDFFSNLFSDFRIIYPTISKLFITWDTWMCSLNIHKANLRDLIAATGLVILLQLDSNRRFYSPCDL